MTIDEYLNLTDDEVQFLVAYDYGTVINNPHFGSAVDTHERPEDQDLDEMEDAEDREIPEVTPLEKYQDLDSTPDT